METYFIPLGKSGKRFTMIDAADLPLLAPYAGYVWNLHTSRQNGVLKEYARCWNGGKPVYLHRVLLGLLDKPDLLGEHENGNGLDNRRSVNLRVANHSQNNHNVRRRNTFRGVYRAGKRFRAIIKHNGKQKSLGTFDFAFQAADAYEAAARELYNFALTPGQAMMLAGVP